MTKREGQTLGLAQPPVERVERVECPYFRDGRMAAIAYRLSLDQEVQQFHRLLSRGYRRVGALLYRNVCESCAACRPIRIATASFCLSRSQKRTAKRNEDIAVKVEARPALTSEKISLYHKYVVAKHAKAEEASLEDEEMVVLGLFLGWSHTIEMDYYLQGRLIGVGIVDEGIDALSSNYFYYDTEHLERRLGAFSILKEIELARAMGKRYHYLGFYIAETQKMSYKKFFRPNEVLDHGSWDPFMR